MSEMVPLDKEFGVATKEEQVAYYKVRRIKVSWDVAGYLLWDNEPHFVSWKDIEEERYSSEDGIIYVTESEFLFICEYVEESFTVDTKIFDLIDEAYNYVLLMRRGNFKAMDDHVQILAERTIVLDRYGEIKK